jgi:hypothetical protein
MTNGVLHLDLIEIHSTLHSQPLRQRAMGYPPRLLLTRKFVLIDLPVSVYVDRV